LLMEAGERQRKAAGHGAFHRADAQHARRCCRLENLLGLLRKVQKPVGIIEKQLPLGRQAEALPVALKEHDTKLLLELLDPGCHVRRHAAKLLRRPSDAQLPGDSAEDSEAREVHEFLRCKTSCSAYSHSKN
jgi:hypothetical protein